MNCRVIFTDTAEADLRDIAFYIAKQSKDKNIAIRFVNKLREKCKNLEILPESGSTTPATPIPDSAATRSVSRPIQPHTAP